MSNILHGVVNQNSLKEGTHKNTRFQEFLLINVLIKHKSESKRATIVIAEGTYRHITS